MKNSEKETQKKTEEEFRKIEKTRRAQDIIGKELQNIDASIKNFGGGDFNRAGSPEQSRQTKFAFNDEKKEVASVAKIEGISLGKGKAKKPSGLTDLFQAKNAQKAQENTRTIDEEPVAHNVLAEDMLITLEEKLSGHINHEGEFTKFELKGVLYLNVNNPALKSFQVHTTGQQSKALQMKLPPSFDKNLWAKGVLALKDKIAPLQPKMNVETLKYSTSFNNLDEAVPFGCSFWFSGAEFSAEIKFNENQQLFESLDNIELHFPKINSSTKFNVQDIEESTYELFESYLVWKIQGLGPNKPNASLIVSFASDMDESRLLPAEVHIESNSVVCELDVRDVRNQANESVKFDFKKRVVAKDLVIS